MKQKLSKAVKANPFQRRWQIKFDGESESSLAVLDTKLVIGKTALSDFLFVFLLYFFSFLLHDLEISKIKYSPQLKNQTEIARTVRIERDNERRTIQSKYLQKNSPCYPL